MRDERVEVLRDDAAEARAIAIRGRGCARLQQDESGNDESEHGGSLADALRKTLPFA
jgi:hypothetical protein